MIATPTKPTSDISAVIRDRMSASAITERSPLRIWLISCASTPASWRWVSLRNSPSVTAIAESLERPMAKAFIARLGM
jgi:hypothetical protein